MHEEDGIILGTTTTAAGILLLSYAVNNVALQVLAFATVAAGFIVIIATATYATLPRLTRYLSRSIKKLTKINRTSLKLFHQN